MKICVAQTKPFKGDIQHNIEAHKKLIGLAVSNGAEAIIFPELSLTGYEPELANDLATYPDDNRFDGFQELSNTEVIIIGVGVPTKSSTGICISMVLFQPYKGRQTYSKKYLHSDEEPFFSSGKNVSCSINNQPDVALAICYELSVPEHAAAAFINGAKTYIASVAKSATGVAKAVERLSEIATNYSMAVLMSNCIGTCDGIECGGKTSVWNNRGKLIGQLDATTEGILIFDTDTEEVIAREMS